MGYFLGPLKQYVDFSGVATRKEYWMYVLFIVVINIVLAIVDAVLGLQIGGGTTGVLSLIFSLGTLLPSISIATRRLHDTNRTGWWQLIGIIPIIGWIVLIVFLVQDSKEPNQYR